MNVWPRDAHDLKYICEIDTCLREKRLHEQAFRLARIGAWECDLETEQLTWTDGVYRLFDIAPGLPLKRSSILDIYCEKSRQQLETIRAEAIRCQQPFSIDVRVRTAKAENRWLRISADVAMENDRAVRLFGAKQDVTRELDEWARLRHMAEHDPLTGLANRGLFDAHYREVVSDDLNQGFVCALVLVDLDRFKQINDTFGHAAGDECLRQVAMRLQRAFRHAVLIARVGGDEFAVLLRSPLREARITQMLTRASSLLCRPLFWTDSRMDVGVSIGAATLTDTPGRKRSNLFERADAALYRAKTVGGNAVHIDTGDMA